MPSLISLITTTYNRAHTLPFTIESILAQTHDDFELLIWDDGSTDDSVAVARHYALKDDRIRVVAAVHQVSLNTHFDIVNEVNVRSWQEESV